MLVRHHIHFIDKPDECIRQEFSFDPPADVPALIGNEGPVYGPQATNNDGYQCKQKHVPAVVSPAGILHVVELVEPGTIISIILRSGHTLQEIGLRSEDYLLVLPNPEGLLVWVTVGLPGIFVLTAQVIDDKGAMRSKLAKHKADLPLQEYLIRQMRRLDAGTHPTQATHADIMNHKEAAAYLHMGESTLYRKVHEGVIRRSPARKYRKSDLEDFLAGKGKRIR